MISWPKLAGGTPCSRSFCNDDYVLLMFAVKHRRINVPSARDALHYFNGLRVGT